MPDYDPIDTRDLLRIGLMLALAFAAGELLALWGFFLTKLAFHLTLFFLGF